MSDEGEAEAAALRLEQALERIAALAARPAAAATLAAQSGVDTAALAGRLDALIAELRGALAA